MINTTLFQSVLLVNLLVWGAVTIAQTLGVSDAVIGLTVVTIGTSLPELAACIATMPKGRGRHCAGQCAGL